MLSSLSSIIWGVSSHDEDTPSPPTTTIHWREDSLDEDDWVVLGRVSQFPGTLSGTFPLPESDTPMLVSPAISEVGEDVVEERSDISEAVPVNLTTNRTQTTKPLAKILRKTEEKHLKSAQLARQRYFGKSSSRKMLKRSNKAAMASGRSNKVGRKTFLMKMGGVHRNLKQC